MTAALSDSSIPVMRTQTPAAYQAYRILQVGFAGAPIIAGVDKFLAKLVTVNVSGRRTLAVSGLGDHTHLFMMIVGVIEIVAGIGVAIKPKIFAYVVALWLVGIMVNLLAF